MVSGSQWAAQWSLSTHVVFGGQLIDRHWSPQFAAEDGRGSLPEQPPASAPVTISVSTARRRPDRFVGIIGTPQDSSTAMTRSGLPKVY